MLTLNVVVHTNDAEHSGCPNLAVVPENSKNLHKLVLADHKLKLCEIADELSMRKLCSKWVPHLLTVDQKQQCINDSERFLQLFQLNKKEFLRKLIKYGSTTSNLQSAEWTAAGESHPKQPKMQASAGQVLGSVLWDAQSILFIDYLEKRRTINSKYYIALLVRLKEEIAKKQPQMKKKKCSFT